MQHLALNSRAKENADVEEVGEVAETDRTLLREVKLRELVAAGLTSQFATVLVAMFGLVPLVFPQFEFLDQFPDPLDVVDWIPDRFAEDQPGFLEFLLQENVLKSLTFVFGGVLVALLGYIFLWFGYKLFISEGMLSWEYGLFTRHTGGLPKKRLQLLKSL